MNERPTPETDKECFVNEGDFVAGDFARTLERQRDEAREQCNVNAKQLLHAVNDRNSLGVQLDLLRDEFRRIEARIGESGLGDNPYLSHIAGYCQRAQKDIAVRYTPIEERDRACERLAVVSLQLDDYKSQRDRLLEAIRLALRTNGGPIDGADTLNGEAYVMVRACAFADLEAATAEVEGRR